MKLAVFDLDHTLLPIDTGDAWTHWMVKFSGLDVAQYDAKAEEFARQYRCGTFSIEEFMSFQLGLLARFQRVYLDAWLEAFIDEVVRPAVRPEALELVQSKKAEGYTLVLATGTHSFVTAPIAALFGIPNLVAARPQEDEKGEFTGKLDGSHSYREGKLKLVRDFIFIKERLCADKLETIDAYSDSINDMPLLTFAAEHGRAFAVNPDAQLRKEALARCWNVVDLFDKAGA